MRDVPSAATSGCTHFPSFSEGLSLRESLCSLTLPAQGAFPFLFGGTFIEGYVAWKLNEQAGDFPSFSEGLSLRVSPAKRLLFRVRDFPSFSEGLSLRESLCSLTLPAQGAFPFLFGGTFIEGYVAWKLNEQAGDFPSFSEGLSLRLAYAGW